MNVLQSIREYIKPPTSSDRAGIIKEVSLSASPGFDFFLLVVLSCSMATLGLITNSPAVIIGAMLVAPLMSPIIGLGLASIVGNVRLAESAVSAIARGAALTVLLSALMTLINRHLPFVVLQELPNEVLARTHPSPIDLVIALAGGLAAAYAMTRPNISAALPGVAIATALMPPLCTVGIGIAMDNWQVAGGALLLFITNTITIAFAAALIFFLQGFAPKARIENNHVPRTLLISATLTILLLVPLSYYSILFFNEASENRRVNEIVALEISHINGSELVELNMQRTMDGLDMVITVRTNTPLNYDQVIQLQQLIATDLQKPIRLKVNQVLAEQFDPLIPPTFTPTTQFTATPTWPPTLTLTATARPTLTPTLTPTPGLVRAAAGPFPTLQLYQSPGGPVIGSIRPGQVLTLLYGRQELDGLIWVEVMDNAGRVGWIPEIYLLAITATPLQ